MRWAVQVAREMDVLTEEARRDRLRCMTVGPQESLDKRPVGDRKFEEGINLILGAITAADETQGS